MSLYIYRIGFVFGMALDFTLFFFKQRLGADTLVGDKCSMLPYDTGISKLCISDKYVFFYIS